MKYCLETKFIFFWSAQTQIFLEFSWEQYSPTPRRQFSNNCILSAAKEAHPCSPKTNNNKNGKKFGRTLERFLLSKFCTQQNYSVGKSQQMDKGLDCRS